MSVAILSVACLALIAAAIWRPGWFVAGAILSAPLHVYRRPLPETLGGFYPPQINLSLFRVCIILASLGLVVHIFRQLRSRNTLNALKLKSLIVYCSVVAAAAIWIAYQSTRSVWALGDTLAAAQLFYLVAIVVISMTLALGMLSIVTALGAAACSAVVPLTYALYQVLEPSTATEKYNRPVPFAGVFDLELGSDQARAGGLSGETLFRPAAFFSDPNFLAVFAAGTVALLDPGNWASKRWQRTALHILRALAAIVVLLTYSRTGLIVLSACLIARYHRLALVPLEVVRRRVGTIVAVLFVLGPVALVGAVTFGVNELKRDESTSSHIQTARDAIDLWWSFPINGAGLGNFGYVYGQAPDRSSAQSFPLTILAEQGVIGLAIFALVLWGPALRLALAPRGLERMPLALVFLIGVWVYDFPLAMDVCAVWLAFLAAAMHLEDLRLPPVREFKREKIPQ